MSPLVPMPLPARRCALLAPKAPDRLAAEHFIRSVFLGWYGARLGTLPPILFALYGPQGQILAAAGLRPAVDERLFLEVYLDEPVDRAISRHIGAPVVRAQVIEVGSLATRGPGYSRVLIQSLTALLYVRRFDWVVFTAVRALRNTFHRLGLNPLPLCAANPARLPTHAEDWGSYYESGPMVMYGDIREGYRRLQASDLSQRGVTSTVSGAATLGQRRA